MQGCVNKENMKNWSIKSPEAPGFHKVIVPENCDCKVAQMYRLNLPAGESYVLESGEMEIHPVILSGEALLSEHPVLKQTMQKYDSFYIPAENTIKITAVKDCIFYIAGAKYEGIGQPSFRKYNPNLPYGDIHQIHGEGIYSRRVMFTLDPNTPASRLICGLTWGGNGGWTSWPPHQHEKDLEEIYCYFDMDAPKFGFHISYLESGEIENSVIHTVQTGTVVQVPRGYHPTVASPGTINTYFWILAAFTPESRRYDLAIADPMFENAK
ncbi:5-deoxy-glucuronate isomerase [Tepidanaerobacter syntrophicus]|jgi:5-deoxy-glucuronate isomerase|uniref:5-deoxy-glucuronate isomerase n=1 Tax=Tepidanaerobacter TaxID=499228 RepID=UPI000ABF5616|nr:MULTISPECIES: 5-deoxy-glucuronate isomerase [Tepidanaerobacter]GLI50328.1 5-deoxy-glucuronate isomerase [Tepidanaerobacter syntrophicus]